jgi:hypothetical protein
MFPPQLRSPDTGAVPTAGPEQSAGRLRVAGAPGDLTLSFSGHWLLPVSQRAQLLEIRNRVGRWTAGPLAGLRMRMVVDPATTVYLYDATPPELLSFDSRTNQWARLRAPAPALARAREAGLGFALSALVGLGLFWYLS